MDVITICAHYLVFLKDRQTISKYMFILLIACSYTFTIPRVVAKDLDLKQIERLSSQAQTAYSANQYQQAINLWLKIAEQNPNPLSLPELALVRSNIASTLFGIGEYRAAIKHWYEAIAIYRDLETDEFLADNLTNQARAYLALGQTLLAEKRLKEAINISEKKKFNKILTTAYLTLGNLQKSTGNYQEAEANFNNSIQYASGPEAKIVANHNLSQTLHSHSQVLFARAQELAAEGKNSEEINYEAQTKADLAWSTAREAVTLSEDIQSLPVVDALLQLVNLSLENERTEAQRDYYLQKAETILSALPPSTRKVYVLINLSKYQKNPVATLMKAIEIAENIGDRQSASFAIGYLGTYYEQNKQYQQALEWTDQAISTASTTQTNKSLYQWHWQKGRIYVSLGQTEQAITAYERAIAFLPTVKKLALGQERQLDFAHEIEPIYRELLHLLLSNNPTTEQLEQALDIRDLLQLSELENFFGDYCLELVEREELPPESKAGLIYTIVLSDATHVIFKQGKEIQRFRLDIAQSQLEQMVKQWRFDLENRAEDAYFFSGRQLYELLLKPIESELASNNLESLIFINDGLLRNAPMAALYDGEKFLVENYTIGVSLGLNLRPNKTELPAKTQALAIGLSEETAEFTSLPFVREEIASLARLIDTRQILNEEFTEENIIAELTQNNFPLVHIATHGQFNGTPEDSFLLTYQEKINLTDLENILGSHQLKFPEQTIDLLVLSACQTAAGNKRATLGLAGVAIRSGVKNALGSLWFLNDSAEINLITNFYRYLLDSQMSQFQALRQAQIKMINDSAHPAIWSNLILIVN